MANGDRANFNAKRAAFAGMALTVLAAVGGPAKSALGQLAVVANDRKLVLVAGVQTVVEGVLVHGFFHGDLHAGNMTVLPDGTFVLFDFGIVGRLTESTRTRLATYLMAVTSNDYASMVRALRCDFGSRQVSREPCSSRTRCSPRRMVSVASSRSTSLHRRPSASDRRMPRRATSSSSARGGCPAAASSTGRSAARRSAAARTSTRGSCSACPRTT